MSREIIEVSSNPIQKRNESEILFEKCIDNVREEMRDNPYIEEAIRVLEVKGYRSSIGCIWNAVVDDLRNKIMHRSLDMFNKEMDLRREIKIYEDFQDYVNDNELIIGAYKIGVISWEARKVLMHAKETRHIFDGHPKSSNPSSIKVLGMLEDCIKYVLSQEYPSPIVNIDEYISLLGTEDFDRNDYSVENALSDLPTRYKSELINRLFTSYIHIDCSSVLRSNIEFIAPILWNLLNKDVKIQIVRRVDKEIIKGHLQKSEYCFNFVELVNGIKYLSSKAKKYLISPLVKDLKKSVDEWDKEDELVQELKKYSGYIPLDLVYDYVYSLTQTYVGYTGSSSRFSRTDFYADGAALIIPDMFEKFDDHYADVFLEVIKDNSLLRGRINNPAKMRRLRNLADIVYEKLSKRYSKRNIFDALLDEKRENEFFKLL